MVCQPGTAIEVDLDQPESQFDGNLFDKENFVQSYGCSPKILKGGETWYTLDLPKREENQWGGMNYSEFKVEFTVVAPTLNIDLWLFNDCDTTYPVCLDFANADVDTIPGEIMTYRNETDQDLTVYLGVDCFRAPTESGTGYFTIKFTNDIIVPTEKTSFGSLRALYR